MRRLGIFLALIFAFGASVAVAHWAVARPGHEDPVGEIFADWNDRLAAFNDWRRAQSDNTPDWQDARHQVLNGDAETGARLIADYGCGACHTIPGIAWANGSVGPRLAGFADRAYVGGVLPNEPGDLVRWLIDPTIYAPDTAMPDLGVTEPEAEHIAAYLYTLGADR